MQLDISNILGRKGEILPFKLEEEIQDIADYPNVVGFLAPVCIDAAFTNEGTSLLLEGLLTTKAAMSCDRCLKPVEIEISVKLNEQFAATDSSKKEIETFSGEIIDLTPVIRRNILFGLPMKVVCKEDCKGLCPLCGKDLNEGVCSCDTSYINPQFESLRSLFDLDK